MTMRKLTGRSLRPSVSEAPPAHSQPLIASGRVPRESLDAPEDLSKQALRQVAVGQLEDEVPRMTDEPAPVLKTRCTRGGLMIGSTSTPYLWDFDRIRFAHSRGLYRGSVA